MKSLYIIETTEIEIEQHKKGLRILFRQEKASYRKSTDNSRLSDLQYLSVDFIYGIKHDFALFKATHEMIDESTFILAAKFYRDIIRIHENNLSPIKKYNRKNLSTAEKWYNPIVYKSRVLKIYSVLFAAFLILAILCNLIFEKVL